MFDFVVVHDGFDHDVGPVTVDFRRREMDESESVALLHPDYVLRTNGVGLPKRLVEVLSIPATKLGSTMVHVVKWAKRREYSLYLAIIADVASHVRRLHRVAADRKRLLIAAMNTITRDDFVIARLQFVKQTFADRSRAARNQNP